MTLPPGVRLGSYEIGAPIGEGGMGEVYRATDTKLKREVAIKILAASVAGDVDRLARFQREAEVLASLNHPNIAGIHGLEESAGLTALVMELVEGEDLSQRIARGAIPIDEALAIAKQIAEALEAAHEQGIIHRDLKPANVKVRADGTVKVLDFGLAKAMEPGQADSSNRAVASPIRGFLPTAGSCRTGPTIRGGPEVYVRPFPAGTPITRVSIDGGYSSAWSPDGRELFYRQRGSEREGVGEGAGETSRMMVVPISITDAFRTLGPPRALFSGDYTSAAPLDSWDLAPDGRFIMQKYVPRAASLPVTRINLVLNWFAELNRLAPVTR